MKPNEILTLNLQDPYLNNIQIHPYFKLKLLHWNSTT